MKGFYKDKEIRLTLPGRGSKNLLDMTKDELIEAVEWLLHDREHILQVRTEESRYGKKKEEEI